MSEANRFDMRELRSFGRMKGRKLSARQAGLLRDLLPAVAVDLAPPPPQSLIGIFGLPVREAWLEIGFGGAEHLIWQAQQNPGVGHIGCEPFEEGVVKALTAISDQGLRNVRLHKGDARDLLRWLPSASLARVFILFPDPWPKTRHRKRRLVATPLLELLCQKMKPGAELRIATDIGDYARTLLESVMRDGRFRWLASGPADWRERPADWPETRYERKAVREGRKRYYFRFTRHD